jgi:hypothetical protein
MIWNRLKNNCCANCNGNLALDGSMYKCEDCEFMISVSKFESLVGKMYSPKAPKNDDEMEDNLSKLNNMEW